MHRSPEPHYNERPKHQDARRPPGVGEASMKWTCSVLTVATLSLVGVSLMGAQDGQVNNRDLKNQDLPAKNPLEGNEDAIKSGRGLFRGPCADCHGMDARGVRAPDITQVWASGRSDDGLFK